MRIVDGNAYSQKSFKGYTHRYIINIVAMSEKGRYEDHKIEVYTTNGDKDDFFEMMINAAKIKNKLIDEEKSSIIHAATFEDDKGASELIDEVLKESL